MALRVCEKHDDVAVVMCDVCADCPLCTAVDELGAKAAEIENLIEDVDDANAKAQAAEDRVAELEAELEANTNG